MWRNPAAKATPLRKGGREFADAPCKRCESLDQARFPTDAACKCYQVVNQTTLTPRQSQTGNPWFHRDTRKNTTGSIMVSITGSQAGVKPVAAHPLFTATAALWGGALLSLGTLAAHPAVLFAGLSELKLSRFTPAGFTAILYNQTLLAAILGATGCIAGMASARLAQRWTSANRAKPKYEVLAMPEAPSLPVTAIAGLRESHAPLDNQSEPDLAIAPAAEPMPPEQRPVLDILSIDLAETVAEAPLDLAEFVNDPREQSVPPIAPLPARPREDTERALRDALATLRDLRGAA